MSFTTQVVWEKYADVTNILNVIGEQPYLLLCISSPRSQKKKRKKISILLWDYIKTHIAILSGERWKDNVITNITSKKRNIYLQIQKMFLFRFALDMSHCMRKASESLGSFLALDYKWMRRNPQFPKAREPVHPVELSKGKGVNAVFGFPCVPVRDILRSQPLCCLRDLQRLSTKRLCYFMHLLKQ